ncbi:MAG: hypothetical protein ACI9HK_000079 [Pirellulaceae bacterium]|jgi:hypothetical protein
MEYVSIATIGRHWLAARGDRHWLAARGDIGGVVQHSDDVDTQRD